MSHKSEREKLVDNYRDCLRKSREAKTEEEKSKYYRMAGEKYQEILIFDMHGDRNIGRFNGYDGAKNE